MSAITLQFDTVADLESALSDALQNNEGHVSGIAAYLAQTGSEAVAPEAKRDVTDELILHRWETHVGLSHIPDADKIAFARAVLYETRSPAPPAPPAPLPGKEYRTGFDEAPSTFNQEDAAPADYPPQSEIEAIAERLGATDPDDSLWRDFAHAAIDADRAQRSGVSADPLPLTDTYVQPVPDKCDRITWRGQYYHLPVSSQSQPLVEPTAAVPTRGFAYEAHQKNGLAWAVAQWNNCVKNRPLVNIHRRSFDDTWRQVIRYFGGDPDALVGPSHDALLAASPQHQVKKGEPS